MKKVLREKNPPCLCDSNWRSPKVLKEQSSQLSLAYAQAPRKSIYTFAFAIESALRDKRKRTGDGIGSPAP